METSTDMAKKIVKCFRVLYSMITDRKGEDEAYILEFEPFNNHLIVMKLKEK